jgi:hypothetical protein
MAFVKVVGSFEIYNFHIQYLVHFYTRFWSFSIFNKGLAARLGSNATATSRAPRPLAGRPRRPSHVPPEVACRPRPTRLPQAGAAPRDASVCSRHAPRASPSSCRTRAVHTADRRSIRGPAIRVPSEERRSTAASWPSSPCRHRRSSPTLFKAPAFSSRSHRRSTAPPWPPSR